MWNQRWRPVLLSAIAVVVIWGVAVAGYTLAKNRKVTAEKLRAYIESVDLAKLSGGDRIQAIQKLVDMLNRLSLEERRKVRLERLTWGWLEQMTDDEKSRFIESTMPTGFKQMLGAFEQLPEDKRRKTIEDTLKRMREAQARLQVASGDPSSLGTNTPVISDELQAKIRTIGLSTFYSQSSAQTKAELAPVLEELQRTMESGRPFHGR